MGLEFIAKKSVMLPVSANKVWEALTNPELIKQYFFGTNTVSKWKVGSPIVFKGIWEGKPYEDKGTILELEKGKLLKYNYWSSFSGTEDVPANYANVTYSLAGDDGKTTLTITQDNCKSAEARDHSEENWGMILENLRKLLTS